MVIHMLKQLGTSFIEILVSLIIVSTMLLGTDVMLLESLRKSEAAYDYSVAIHQLDVITGLLMTMENTSTQEIVEKWNQQNWEVLPEGRGVINGNYPDYEISIFWGNFNGQNCITNNAGKNGCLRFIFKATAA
jgi:hypothetical protein